MSIKLTSYVWDRSKQEGAALLALLAIADHANDDGIAWPSIARIAQRARVSPRQAQRLIQKLINEGELEIVSLGGKGPRSPSIFRVTSASSLEILSVEIRMTSSAKKGDIEGSKGDIAMSPEPSIRILKEPSCKKPSVISDASAHATPSEMGGALAPDPSPPLAAKNPRDANASASARSVQREDETLTPQVAPDPPSPRAALQAALLDVTQANPATCKGGWAAWGKTVNSHFEAGMRAEDVRHFWEWWQVIPYKGRQGERPDIWEIGRRWGEAKAMSPEALAARKGSMGLAAAPQTNNLNSSIARSEAKVYYQPATLTPQTQEILRQMDANKAARAAMSPEEREEERRYFESLRAAERRRIEESKNGASR